KQTKGFGRTSAVKSLELGFHNAPSEIYPVGHGATVPVNAAVVGQNRAQEGIGVSTSIFRAVLFHSGLFFSVFIRAIRGAIFPEAVIFICARKSSSAWSCVF